MMKHKIVMMPAERAPYVTNISDKLENLQRIVGGHIEAVQLPMLPKDTVLICNEDGINDGLPFNLSCPFYSIFGDAFLVGVDGDEFCSISDDAATEALKAAKREWERNS